VSSRRVRLTLLLLLSAGTTYYYFALLLPQVRAVRVAKGIYGPYNYGGDLYPIWLTSRQLLTRHQNPYSDQTTRQIQAGFFGRPLAPGDPAGLPLQNRAFSYPFYADLLAAPLSWLPFRTVQIAGAVLFPLLIVASVALWFRALGIPCDPRVLVTASVLTLISYPVLEALYALQATVIVFFLLSVSLAALAAGRSTVAGISLALATIKPQLTVFFILVLLLWVLTRWGSSKRLALSFAFLSFALMMLLLLAASFALLPGWFSDWWRAALEYRRHAEPPPLAELLFGKLVGAMLAAVLLGLVAWTAWKARRLPFTSPEATLAIATALAVSAILLPSSVAVYDQVILLPGILWLYHYRSGPSSRRAFRWLRTAVWVVLAWQWIAASGVSAVAGLWPDVRHNAFAILLPLRAATALPFVVTATLGLAAIQSFSDKRISAVQLPAVSD